MTSWLIDPFQADMVLRALVAGVTAACLCSLVGCWVLLRRSVFLGEAMTHGMLPGFAVALTGFLFGDVFAVRTTDLAVLGVALLLTLGAVVAGHRAFVAVTFDPL